MKSTLLIVLVCFIFSITALSQTTITGHLLGCDGQPMAMSHVHIDGGLGRFNIDSSLLDVNYARVQTDSDGSFKISTAATGAFYLAFTGVGHEMMQIPLVAEKAMNLQVEVQLRAVQYVENFGSVEVLYNEYDGRPSSKLTSSKMKREPNGSYVAEISTELPSLSYVLANIAGAPSKFGPPICSGTMADTYEYWNYGGYFSVIHPKDNRPRVTFDPARLKRSKTGGRIRFIDSTCVQARFAWIHDSFGRIKEGHDLAFREHFKAGKSFKEFSYDWTPIAADLRRRIESETVQILRDELIIEYLELATISGKGIDRSFLKRRLQEVSPLSLAWVYHVTAAEQILAYAANGGKYLDRILTEHPNRNFRAQLMLVLCTSAKTEHRQADYLRLFYRLINDFPDTPAARAAKDSWYPRGKIKPGAKIPEFSFASLDNSSITLTKTSFKEKYLLIDFWATWCGPCVGELKFLHKAYEMYHNNGLEIMSISFDQSPDIVRRFRSTKWPMPWHNVVVDEKDQPDVSQTFEVAFPRPILVDPKGRIIEMDDNLRGEELEKTLKKYLGSHH